MSRLLRISLAIAFAVFLISPVTGLAFIGGDTPMDGVYCEVNGVKLFAANADDCKKAGGKVTHIVTTQVNEVGSDNPNQEPKIQRGKDKKPKAP